MMDSDFRPLSVLDGASVPEVAFVPNELGGRYAGYLFLLAGPDGPVLSLPGIIGGIDDSEPDTASAEALIGCPIGPWERRADGWYAEIERSPVYQKDCSSI